MDMAHIQNIDVKKERERHGMSQEVLSQRLGMSRPTLVRIEKGERALSMQEEALVRDVFGIAHESNRQTGMRISVPLKNLRKCKEVLLYILGKTAGKPNVGMTALYKLLYFIDFDYYEKYEEQLMGLTYMKNTYGPTPREFVSVMEDMKVAGEAEEVKSNYFTFEQRKFLPRRTANLSLFSAQELAMVDSVLARYSDMSAKQLSDLTHEDTPWAAAGENENVKYEHVFYRPEKLSVREYDEL
jgi:transcriptional regulator with XRE-family HTH domain